MNKSDIKKLVDSMTLEEKAGMCSGKDFWHLKGVERLNILLKIRTLLVKLLQII